MSPPKKGTIITFELATKRYLESIGNLELGQSKHLFSVYMINYNEVILFVLYFIARKYGKE